MAMPLRTFSISIKLYTEFKNKVNSIQLTNGDRISVSAAIRGLITLYVNGEISNSQIISISKEEKGAK